ncbi:hypothetical protein FOVG_19290 [Fusarium oxysporum f. sp. pisi HDV247]|uniref:DDE Tnp4 domain-containing protein n=1 Tax=Fusarium oxysporum f. sp. pisi HDV247 TaxID=1080344 RepID=W9N965_FUSOX|nr:hypothetical protein FOVG_19290 [Fusarium oxysporum f. sp. pisi HDV247]
MTANVLVEVDLDDEICTYVLAGAEGSMHDSAVMRFAVIEDLQLINNRLVLADAGFGGRHGLLTPFVGAMYRLRDFRERGEQPANMHEAYNLHHAQLRSAVGRVIGQWKPGLFNFIKLRGELPEVIQQRRWQELTLNEQEVMQNAADRAQALLPTHSGVQWRRFIGDWIWEEEDISIDEEIEYPEESSENGDLSGS